MTPRYARLVLGLEIGTPTEQHLLAIMRDGSWDDLQRLASGWPDLVSAFLLARDQPAQAEILARRG